MDFAPVYLLERAWYRFMDFFHHWYADGSRVIGHRFVAALERADHSLAIRVTFAHFFEPLYKDYTVVGRVLGVIFRTVRILLGIIVYALIAALFFVFYAAWVAAPAVIIFYVAKRL